MSPLEQRALLLGQVASLMKHGVAAGEALSVAMQGLTDGAVRAAADHALSELRAGRTPDPSSALGCALMSAGEVECSALAVDARLVAESALRGARLVLAAATAGPLLLATFWAWVLYIWPLPGERAPLLLAVRFVGPVLAVGAALASRRLGSAFAPGARQGQKAALVLKAAAVGVSVGLDAALAPVESEYLRAREARVGAVQAARDLADELLAESARSLLWFRTLAPIVGAVLLLPVVVFAAVIFAGPIFATSYLFVG